MKVLEMITRDDEITRRDEKDGKPMPYLENTYGWQRKNLSPNTRYACCMIPIPEGYRLITQEEQEGISTANKYLLWNYGKPTWKDGRINVPWGDSPNIVPIKTEKDTKIEALQARLKDAEAVVAKVRDDLENV